MRQDEFRPAFEAGGILMHQACHAGETPWLWREISLQTRDYRDVEIVGEIVGAIFGAIAEVSDWGCVEGTDWVMASCVGEQQMYSLYPLA